MADRLPYVVEKVERIAETAELRVSRFTLAPGQEIPWHFHNNITDRFYCLEGKLRVETRAPRQEFLMEAGGDCAVEPRIAHRVSNAGSAICRFLILQGIGAYDYVPVGGAAAAK